MARAQMTLLFVNVDKKLASTNPFALFLFSFSFGLHSRGRPELHQSCYRALCTVEELAAAIRYHHRSEVRSLTITEPDGDSRAPLSQRAAMHQIFVLCMLSHSGSIGRACLYRRVKAGANMAEISTGDIFLAKADHTWLMSRPSGSVPPLNQRI